ncbi:MAG TPA: ATP-binding protein, partial [Acidothermaceae bacterium]
MTDRTTFREAEESLRKSEAQYRQIVEATSDGIIQLDERRTVVFVNQRLADMLGYDASEMIGRDFLDFVSSAAQTTFSNSLAERKAGRKQPVDTIYCHRDGRSISVSVAGAATFDAEGRFSGTLGLVRDMTERNKLQSQLMVSDRMASIGTLAAGVAHEINNPLAAVLANLDFIAESMSASVQGSIAATSPASSRPWLCGEIQGPLDDAREAARRMRFVVRDLKVFSHPASDDLRAPVNVRALMDSSLRMAENEIRHRARVVKQYGPVPPLDINEARIGQVFLNLLVNAAQALPEDHADNNEIHVDIRLDGAWVIIEVRDTGSGIPPEIIGRIFDAFFTTKAVGVGTGLGLAISHRIVTDMGGDLTVESTMGTGTLFRVSLPVTRAVDVAVATIVEPPPAPKVRGHILV